jgi:arylsulfatase A-like enzyme
MFQTDPALQAFLKQRRARMSADVLTANNGYDGEIRYLDEHIGRLLDKLREKGIYDRAAIVFTSDHGEGLGQHNWLYHSRTYNEQMSIPLIVRLPGHPELRGKRLDGLVSLIDILPMLAANLELPLTRTERSQFEGVDVLDDQRKYVFAERTPHHKADPERDEYYALLSADWKLFLRPRGENQLFDLRTDSNESQNVIASQPDVAEEMIEEIDDQLDEYDKSVEALSEKPKAEIGEDVKERLRQLGYDM